MGNQRTRHTARRRLRRRLEAEGWDSAAIDGFILTVKAAQDRAAGVTPRQALSRAERAKNRAASQEQADRERRQEADLDPARLETLQEETWRRLNPDDRTFRPDEPDPLTVGQARAEGAAARAVRRGKAVTSYEFDQMAKLGPAGPVRSGGS